MDVNCEIERKVTKVLLKSFLPITEQSKSASSGIDSLDDDLDSLVDVLSVRKG